MQQVYPHQTEKEEGKCPSKSNKLQTVVASDGTDHLHDPHKELYMDGSRVSNLRPTCLAQWFCFGGYGDVRNSQSCGLGISLRTHG